MLTAENLTLWKEKFLINYQGLALKCELGWKRTLIQFINLTNFCQCQYCDVIVNITKSNSLQVIVAGQLNRLHLRLIDLYDTTESA